MHTETCRERRTDGHIRVLSEGRGKGWRSHGSGRGGRCHSSPGAAGPGNPAPRPRAAKGAPGAPRPALRPAAG